MNARGGARVAVTGLGIVAPLGDTRDELHARLMAGESAVAVLPSPLRERLRAPIAASVAFDAPPLPPAKLKLYDRVTQFALVAGARALADAGLDLATERRERCGVAVGTGMGGAGTTDDGYRLLYAERSDRIPPFSVLAAMNNAPAAWLGIEHGLTGPNLTYSTACSSSAVAIGEAARRIRHGECDVMLAGGAEAALTLGVLRAWEAMRTLAEVDAASPAASCRPFAKTRTGLVLGEGAAFVVLESFEHAERRGATVHAELAGYGLTTDCAHITRPTVDGQASAMRAALADAGLDAGEIGYVNAHGTATAQNDAIETRALHEVFGARARDVPVSSTKSMHGHLLGAAGALEFVVAVESLLTGAVPPTMHLDVPDPECDLDYVANAGRTGLELRAVMSNSFAFGGTNAVLVARRV